MPTTTSQSNFAPDYLIYGWHIMWQKGLRRYALMPLLINLVLFSAGVVWVVQSAPEWVAAIMTMLPSYLQFLEWLLWPLLVITIILVFALSFTTLATIIAAPFNSLLAEQVVFRRSGLPPRAMTALGLLKELPRVLSRELQKLLYLLPRLLIVGLLALLLPVVGQVLWLLFIGWMITIQYLDYPFDNQHISFRQMRRSLAQQRGKSLTFGLTIALLASLPLVNLLIMPVAVCGASALWVDHFHQPRYANSTPIK